YFGFSLADPDAVTGKGSERLTNHKQRYSGLSSAPSAIGKPSAGGQQKGAGVQAAGIPFSQAAESGVATGGSTGKQDWLAKKEEQARERKRQNDLKKVEAEIEKLETRDAELDAMLSDEAVYSDPARLVELNNEKTEISARLEVLMEEWETLGTEE
ncbi:MAG: hypothetical protein K2O03_07760, partial [Lachnospiraceae bacterium]|nr:hypothetical protein [Lachnospiraceae bacterium]